MVSLIRTKTGYRKPSKSIYMKYIAHRGDHGGVMENTMEAFRSALHYPIHMIETDLRLTSDKHWVLHHDRNIKYENGHADINELNLQIVSRYGIPTVDDLLGLVDGKAEIYFDIKDQQIDQLQKLVDKLAWWSQNANWRADQYYLASFNSEVIKELLSIRTPAFNFRIGFITGNNLRSVPKEIYQRVDFIGASYDFLDSDEIKEYKKIKSTVEIYVYTLNDIESLKGAIKMNVDGLLSDYSHLFRDLLFT